MSEIKELNFDELEKVSGGISEEELAELNVLCKKCSDAFYARDTKAFSDALREISDYRDTHPDARVYCTTIIKICREVGKRINFIDYIE